ncbi:BH0509 family protein [Metabacillus litoralis]|nr:BH0509 family protein [Metabacillus litoralis]
MMSRQERRNMIEFIERMRKIDKDSMLYMTDADIEHIYSTVYNSYIELAE